MTYNYSLKDLFKMHSVRMMALSIVTSVIASVMMLWQPETIAYASVYIVVRELMTVATIYLRNVKQDEQTDS